MRSSAVLKHFGQVRISIVVAVVLAAGVVSTSTASARSCGRVVERVDYGSISASSVRIEGPWGCSQARAVVARYFKMTLDSAQTEGGCAQKRNESTCRVGRYRCQTGLNGRSLAGSCTSGTQRVRFRETDRFYG